MVFDIGFRISKHLWNTVCLDIVLIIHFLTKKTFILISLKYPLLCGLLEFLCINLTVNKNKY